MITTLIAAGIVAAGNAAPLINSDIDGSAQRGLRLERTYTEGETDTYKLTVDISEGEGTTIKGTAEVAAKVTKLLEGGRAEIKMTSKTFTLLVDGMDVGEEAPISLTTKYDKHGMPEQMNAEENDWVYILIAAPGYVPAAEIKPGENFNIEWSSSGKSVRISGKGALLETTKIDETAVAKLKLNLEIFLEGEDAPGVMEITSYVDIETGKLLQVKGKVTVEETTVVFAVEKI